MQRLTPWLLAAALALPAGAARAEFFIVANASNPQRALTVKEALDLYTGRARTFANGDFALVFDLPRDHPQRAAFYQALAGMSPAQLNSYWSRLMFSGQVMPPQALPDEGAMTDLVRRNPSALGWLSKEPSDKQIRVLLVVKDVH